jgi:glyoxylase-like metal-dependent hydrolase (beta-lactamase superfamily II)
MTHLHFDHCGGSVQWNKRKRVMNQLLKMLNSGVMKITGMGNKPNPERKRSCLKIFCQCKKVDSLIKDRR